MNNRIIEPLSAVGMADIERVGGKCASLGEMTRNLSQLGIRIPDGFVITTDAYFQFIAQSGLEPMINEALRKVDHNNVESLRRTGLNIRQAISNARFPYELSHQIIESYEQLSKTYGQSATDVAVRSSATAEDLPDASFAGQQETFLNVRGPAALIDSVRNCFASLFTDRAISYRRTFGYDAMRVGLSVCVQKMVRSDLATSGVAFSLDTESGFKDVVMISGSYGLGEMVVQGAVSPDEYLVFKPARERGFASIIEKKLGVKDKLMVYGDHSDQRTRIIPVEESQRGRFCLEDGQVLQLADFVMRIEEYYSQIKDKWCPVDIEWAIDGLSGDLFIVQARPETVHSRREQAQLVEYRLDAKAEKKLIGTGIAVGDKVGSGRVTILYSLDKRVGGREFMEGDILVTEMTDPDWEPVMKKAAAIITNKGGRTCHAAIVAREMGVPAIVGCGDATSWLRDGQVVTASCAEGAVGQVYEGRIPFEKVTTDLSAVPQTRTPVMLNVGSPDTAFGFAQLPHHGVGLAREEFIINNYIQAHPLALLRHSQLGDAALSASIAKLTRGFDSGEEYFIAQLSFGIARIAAAFYPRKVIVRFSDFKSNEYRNLLGGNYFEPQEENPMIGWRGASRYYSAAYKPAFAMECRAIRKVREEMGLSNVVVMVPFCRTVEELKKVQAVMAEQGLERGSNGLEVYLMAELPSNIILAGEFASLVDGFSIGSNDLTQLTLGIDRDSALVAHLYDERNAAVKSLLRQLIRTAKQHRVKVGICGQGPSDFPDFAQFLVEEGIDSISVTPDALIKTLRSVHAVEQVTAGEMAEA
ncbi:MAG TPA: phosphoenolpyruvate synthase [Puia sp.]|jgi:pyruvate,water dikinase|nr:phosphoenolpyruvate synthase [Puia sp.]